jgi:hypothetical protein
MSSVMPTKKIMDEINEKLMAKLQDMVNQKVQDALNKYKYTTNKTLIRHRNN